MEVHSYDKTEGGFNTTLAAFLIGAQANAFWNLGSGGWFCDVRRRTISQVILVVFLQYPSNI